MNKKIHTKLNHAESILPSLDPLSLKKGEIAFQCPKCGVIYGVRGGSQMQCRKYKFIRNGQLVKADGCGFSSGLFNVVAYNFHRQENPDYKCVSRVIVTSRQKVTNERLI